MLSSFIFPLIKVVAKDAPAIANILQFPPTKELLAFVISELCEFFGIADDSVPEMPVIIKEDPSLSDKLVQFQHSFIMKVFEPLTLNLDVKLSFGDDKKESDENKVEHKTN